MKKETDIVAELRKTAKVGDGIVKVLDSLAKAMAENPNIPVTAEVIRRTADYIDLLEKNARMAEQFQNIIIMAMETEMFNSLTNNSTKH
jgi:uncharacterized membrane-anchored protein YjiN (DUF445 family)